MFGVYESLFGTFWSNDTFMNVLEHFDPNSLVLCTPLTYDQFQIYES